MSIIAIKGIPFRFALAVAVDMIKNKIGGPFEPLNFSPQNTGKGTKTLYIRLSERLDPIQVVDKINSAFKTKGYVAFVPSHVPDLPISAKKSKVVMTKKQKKLEKTPSASEPHKVIVEAHYQLFKELQYKFPGLYNLSAKTKHKLLDEIAAIVGDRLKKIMSSQPGMNCFEATSAYRKSHPHFADFQLVLSTLHRLQDAAGAPRMQIQESELSAMPDIPFGEAAISEAKIKAAYTSYAQKVTTALTEHINSLNHTASTGDSDDKYARMKVSLQLKKMLPYLGSTMHQIIEQHFIAREKPHRRVRIYGEPYLPNREQMAPLTRKFVAHGYSVRRVQTMYNLITFVVEPRNYAALRAMDQTTIGGAKLIIRDTDILIRNPDFMRFNLAAHFGGVIDESLYNDDDDDDDEPEQHRDDDGDQYMEDIM